MSFPMKNGGSFQFAEGKLRVNVDVSAETSCWNGHAQLLRCMCARANNTSIFSTGAPNLLLLENGHGNPQWSMAISGSDWLEVPIPYIRPYFSGLCKGISQQNMARNMVQYLHFRILKFPLKWRRIKIPIQYDLFKEYLLRLYFRWF